MQLARSILSLPGADNKLLLPRLSGDRHIVAAPQCGFPQWPAREAVPALFSTPSSHYKRADRGEIEGNLPMLVRWLDYDPIAVTVLIVGIGAISFLALSI